ncbi:MAG: secretin N-terminal domain-containing protein [Elusimicrobiota bacterium]
MRRSFFYLRLFITAVFLMQIIPGSIFASVELKAVSMTEISQDSVDVMIATSEPAKFEIFRLKDSDRIVLDIHNAVIGLKKDKAKPNSLVKDVRYSQFDQETARIVLDLAEPCSYVYRSLNNIITVALTKDVIKEAQGDEAKNKKKDEKKRMDLDFYKAELRDVLRVLSLKSGINIIPDDNVEGLVTVHLENVTFEEALDTILLQKNYSWERIGDNRIRVIAKKMVTTRVFKLNYSNSSDMITIVKNLLSEQGKVVVDERINTLIISDELQHIRRIEELIKELDKQPQQVRIEAKLIEVDITNDTDLGVNWSYAQSGESNGVTTSIGGAQLGSPGGGGAYLSPGELAQQYKTDGNYDNISGKALSVAAGGTGMENPLSPQGGAFSIGAVSDNMILNARLSLLQKKGKTKTLSNPKIVTVNNKTAHILIGEKVPYVTSTIVPGTGTTQETTFVDIGIQLEVTPTINADDRIILKVHPEVSTLRALNPEGPRIATREADTTVLIKSGETIAIGGLITDADIQASEQIPILGELPILGYLFKHKTSNKERVELIIFLTPTIVED